MFKSNLFLFTIFIWIELVRGDSSLLNTSYYNLFNKVLEGYNPNVIPLINPNTSLNINVDLTLIQIIQIV